MDYREKLIVRPNSKVRLKDFDPAWHGVHEAEEGAAEDLAKNVAKLTRLQYLSMPRRSIRCSLSFRASTQPARTAPAGTSSPR
jgi:hypothetical protein